MFKDIQRPYIRAEKTDVLTLFKNHGWMPPSENPLIQQKWATYRNLQTINEVNNELRNANAKYYQASREQKERDNELGCDPNVWDNETS